MKHIMKFLYERQNKICYNCHVESVRYRKTIPFFLTIRHGLAIKLNLSCL